MAKVNLEEWEASVALKSKQVSEKGILEKTVEGKTAFKGPFLPDWFDDREECSSENSRARQQAEYRKSGLDEFGRTKRQVALHKKKAELLKKKNSAMEEVIKIDVEIQRLKVEDFEEKPENKQSKK